MSRVDKSTKSFRPIARPPLKKSATPSLPSSTAPRPPSLASGPPSKPPPPPPPPLPSPQLLAASLPPLVSLPDTEADDAFPAPVASAPRGASIAPSEPSDAAPATSQPPAAASAQPASPPEPPARAAAEADAKSRMMAMAKAARERNGRRWGSSTPGLERQRSAATPVPIDPAGPLDAVAEPGEEEDTIEPQSVKQRKQVTAVSAGAPINLFEPSAFSSPPASPPASPHTSFHPTGLPVPQPVTVAPAGVTPEEPDAPLFREASLDPHTDIPVAAPSAPAQISPGQASQGKKRKLGNEEGAAEAAHNSTQEGKAKANGNVTVEPDLDYDGEDHGEEQSAPAQARKGRKTATKRQTGGKSKSKPGPSPEGQDGASAGDERATAQSSRQSKPASDAVAAEGCGEQAQEDEDDEDISPRLKRQRLIAKRRAQGKGSAQAPATKPPRAGRKPKAARKAGEGEPEGGEEGAGRAKRKPRAKAPADPTKRKRRKRASTSQPGDPDDPTHVPDDDEEEDLGPIDPMTITMEDICADSSRGRASSLLQERMIKTLERQKREKEERQRERARRLETEGREDLDDGTEAAGGFADGHGSDGAAADGEQAQDGERAAAEDDPPDLDAVMNNVLASGPARWPGEDSEAEDPEDDEEEVAPVQSMFAPRLRMVNGEMVLDQDSLQVDHQAASLERLEEMEVVEGGDELRLVNGATWSKHQRGERWGAEDTERFYEALRMFGTDFEMIARLFPGRDRRQIRNKFNREEKLRPEVLTAAVTGRSKKAVQLEEYGRAAGRDLTGPAPEDPMDAWREQELGGGGGVARAVGDDGEDEDGDEDEAEVVVVVAEEAEQPDPTGDERETPAWGEQGLLDTWED